MSQAPTISAVIPTIHRPVLVVRCIEGLLAGEWSDFEIIVVDQSKNDGTRLAIAERFGGDERVRYFHSDVTGAATARNFGLARSRGAAVAFLDDDVLPAPTLLGAYATCFREAQPSVGIIGGRIVPTWGIPCPAWYPRELAYILGLYDLGSEPQDYPAGDMPPSANLAIRREVMEQVGGFDARLGYDAGRRNTLLAGEDVQLAEKVRKAGYSIRYEPAALVSHLIGAYKLRLGFLLRRFYWEGRTLMRLRLYGRVQGYNRDWAQVWRDSRTKRVRRVNRDLEAGRGLRSRLVLLAAYLTLLAGAGLEVARHPFPGEPGPRREGGG